MGIFDNATSVVINNKEVQSIVITSNNAVIYQKSVTPTTKITTEMVFVRQLTTGISTYKLQDINGNYIGGKTIVIYKNGTEWATMTTGAKNGTFLMYTDSGYVAIFDGDDTYESCTLTM